MGAATKRAKRTLYDSYLDELNVEEGVLSDMLRKGIKGDKLEAQRQKVKDLAEQTDKAKPKSAPKKKSGWFF